MKILNLDGTPATVSRHPPGHPEAPPGYMWRSPDPDCHDPDCGGSCWAIHRPVTIPAEQFEQDMARWRYGMDSTV